MSKRYLRNEAFQAEDLGDGVLLLNIEDNLVIELNRTGARLWRRLEQPATRYELVQTLKENYPNVPVGNLEADMDTFLSQATASRAIEET